MKVIHASITGVSISLQDITGLGDPPGWDIFASETRVSAMGFLADKSRVNLEIRLTPEELIALNQIFDRIVERITSED